MNLRETLASVANRGNPPAGFVGELIAWGMRAPAEIFAKRPGFDIYSSVLDELGPWHGETHRKAVMLEVLRVLAGFESSWRWKEGRDVANPASDTPKEIEAGAWQVSADSMAFGADLRELVKRRAGSVDPVTFQKAMKQDHALAIEYAARLLRHTVKHNGPVRDGLIHRWLRRGAVSEFEQMLNPEPNPNTHTP